MSADPSPARVLAPGWQWILLGFAVPVVFAMALQKGGATAINAIMFTTQTAVSSLVGVAYLADRVRTGFGTPAVVGFPWRSPVP